jgi:ubiquinone/menaquinone biosynthesis C-methylase UbiE
MSFKKHFRYLESSEMKIKTSQYDNKKLWEDLKKSESNTERIQRIIEMIPKGVTSLADIGCGNGIFLNTLKQSGKISKLIGIDFSNLAMEDLQTEKLVGDITDIPLKTNSYEIVSALEVLEHLDKYEFEKAKKELSRVSSRYILISVPFNEDLEIEFFKCPSCKTHFNTSHHKRTFSEEKMKRLFIKEGFNPIDIQYISRRNEYIILTSVLKKYRKIFGIEKNSGMVCPVCGYKQETVQRQSQRSDSKARSSWIKKIWPKRYTYKWIATLYMKQEEA